MAVTLRTGHINILLYAVFAVVATATLLLPVLAYFGNLAPTWVPWIVPITSVIQLSCLALAWAVGAPREIISRRRLTLAVLVLVGLALAYLEVLGLFTYLTPRSSLRLARGFVCNDLIRLPHPECPWVPDRVLQDAQYNADVIWQPWSIHIVEGLIVTLWVALFSLLSGGVGRYLKPMRRAGAGYLLGSRFGWRVGSNAPRIFISYRRQDTLSIAHRIRERLVVMYGADAVFIDSHSLSAGTQWKSEILSKIANADIVVAIIGVGWSGSEESGNRRIFDPQDMVRIEIEASLEGRRQIIPVLVGEAKMPPPSRVPEALAGLTEFQAIRVDEGIDFDIHLERLIERIDELGGEFKRRSSDDTRGDFARSRNTAAPLV